MHHNQTTDAAPWPVSLLSHPVVVSVSSDIVSGQIIATVIVVAFVAVFLLREWISQNARPGVFDDAEGPPELQEMDLPPHLAHLGDALQREEERERATHALEPGADVQLQRTGDPPQTSLAVAPDLNIPAPTQTHDDKGKGKDPRLADWDTIKADLSERRTKGHSWGDAYGDSSSSAIPSASRPPSPLFNAAIPAENVLPPSSELAPTQSFIEFGMDFSSWSPLDYVNNNAPENLDVKAEPASSTPQTPQLRPPLFSTALLPNRDTVSPSHRSSDSRSRGSTPLQSPSLATYCAPEELEAGSSDATGYFTQREACYVDDISSSHYSEVRASEYNTFFREPNEGETTPGKTITSWDTRTVDTLTVKREDSEEIPPLVQITDNESDEEWDHPFDKERPQPDLNEEPVHGFFHDEAEDADAGDEPVDDFREQLAGQRDDVNDGDEGDIGMEDDMEGALEGGSVGSQL